MIRVGSTDERLYEQMRIRAAAGRSDVGTREQVGDRPAAAGHDEQLAMLPSPAPRERAERRRVELAARLLDGLIFLPAFLVAAALALALVAPHAGPIFPRDNADSSASIPTPGFVWLYLAVAGAALVSGVLYVAYETIATVRYGRTLGKRWMHIRPVSLHGQALGSGLAFGRAALQWVANFLGWLAMLDSLWCLWDADRQCLHDKIVGTLVVND